MDDIRNVIPKSCEDCGEKLHGTDPDPAVRQWVELADIQPEVVEFLLHSLTCFHCGKKTQGKVPVENRESYGPRLQAFVAQAPEHYRLSKRNLAVLANPEMANLLGAFVEGLPGCEGRSQRLVMAWQQTP